MVQRGQDFLFTVDGERGMTPPGESGGREIEITGADTVGDGDDATQWVKLDSPIKRLEDEQHPAFDTPSRDRGFGSAGANVVPVESLRETLDTDRIFDSRSRTERIADLSKKAETTDDPLQWASDPSRWDMKGVDTPSAAKDNYPEGSSLDRSGGVGIDPSSMMPDDP